MGAVTDETQQREPVLELRALPGDVQSWLERVLEPGESVAALLYADIGPSGEFAERWTFLTNRRLLVLSPNGRRDAADIEFQMPLEQIEDAEVRQYIGSGALVVSGPDKGQEVVRFSLGSHREAVDIVHVLKEIVRERKAGKRIEKVPPPPARRPEHRCSKCGWPARSQMINRICLPFTSMVLAAKSAPMVMM